MNVQKLEEWIGAEAERDGKPLVVRARKFFCEPVSDPHLPLLFVIKFRYKTDDRTGLPNHDEYCSIEKFEKETIDEMEKLGYLKLVFIETNNGTVCYYAYTSDVELSSKYIDKSSSDDLNLDFSANSDPGWQEYKRLIGYLQL